MFENSVLFLGAILWGCVILIGRAWHILTLVLPKTWAEKQSFPGFRGIKYIGPLHMYVKPKWTNFQAQNPNMNAVEAFLGTAKIFENEQYYVFEIFRKKTLWLYNPDIIEKYFKGSKESLQKGSTYRAIELALGQGLVTSNLQNWKPHRKILRPYMKESAIKNHTELIYNISDELIEQLKYHEKQLDIQKCLTKVTMKAICGTLFGACLNDESRYILLKSIQKMVRMSFRKFTRPHLWSNFVFERSEDGKQLEKAKHLASQIIGKIVAERKEALILQKKEDKCEETKYTLMDIMILNQSEGSFTDDDIFYEIITFLVAGEDTTAYSVTSCLFYLGHHPEIQDKVAQEVHELLGQDFRTITVEDIRSMKYLDCVIKETWRLCNPVPVISRTLGEDLEIDGKIMPKGIECIIFLSALHKQSRYFPNPEVFNPERFTKDPYPGSFIPFSLGPRDCIGKSFATLEIKILVANIIRHFKVSSLEFPDKLPLYSAIVTENYNYVKMNFTPRII